MQFKFKIVSLFFIFITSQMFSYSQNNDEKKLLRTVQKHYDAGEYEIAIKTYEELIKLNPNHFDYQYELALIYYHELNKKNKSISYFNKAIENMKKDSVPELYFLLAQAYQSEGEYSKAIETFYHYRDIDSNFLKVNVKRYVEQCNYGIDLLTNPDTNLIILNIGHPINTDKNEYSAIIIPNTTTLLYTAKDVTNMFGELIETIHVKDYISDEYEKPKIIGKLDIFKNLVIDSEEHSSIVNISEDGKTIFLYSNSLLYSSQLNAGIWSIPKKLHDNINFNFSNRHCSFTADGKEIYFSSFDRKNQNNIEIYYAQQMDDGNWTEAIEIGSPVNTRKNEDSPEISANGDTLYFASNGHKGMGGFDIFMSIKNDSVWSKPINMGTPINSPWNDIYYNFDNAENRGFISSDRKGGIGGMDIYTIERK
jgi:tetratricopeptide (TPR) repeat protein